MSEKRPLEPLSETELSLAQIRLMHSIPRDASPSIPPPPIRLSFKTDITVLPAEVPSASTATLAPDTLAFYGPPIAVMGEFCIVLLLQFLFYFKVMFITGAGSHYIAIGLGGALLALTGLALLVVNSSWDKTQWAIMPLHSTLHALCCCWLSTYWGLAFFSLSYIVLFNLLLCVLLNGLLGRFPTLVFVAPLPALVANLVLLNLYVDVWYVVLPLTVYLALQTMLQNYEVRQGHCAQPEWAPPRGRGFTLSVALRFCWRRMRPMEVVPLG